MGVDSFPQQVSRHHGEVSGLDRGGPERPQRPLVRLHKRQAPVWQVVLLAEVSDNRGNLPQMAPRQPREEVMLQLKLEPAEEPIHVRRAVNVDCSGGLFLEPVVPLGRAYVDVGGEVVEGELDVLD